MDDKLFYSHMRKRLKPDFKQSGNLTPDELANINLLLKKSQRLGVCCPRGSIERLVEEFHRGIFFTKSSETHLKKFIAELELDIQEKEDSIAKKEEQEKLEREKKEKEDALWLAGVEQRARERKTNKEEEEKRAHEFSLKEMDLEIERERSKTMEKMLEMAQSMNMDLETLKKLLDNN